MKTITLETQKLKTRRILVPSEGEPLTVVIDRKTWYRGKGEENSRLLSKSGKMCCLGFDALALGFKKCDIREQCTPHETAENVPGLSDEVKTTEVCQQMMDVNDTIGTPAKVREAKLKSLAKLIHRKFVFKS